MPIIFELSKNPSLLQQYYALRETAFREEIGIDTFDGSEEPADREGHILIAHKDGKCVGGARIAPRRVKATECDELALTSTRCCAWERAVLDPEIRTIRLARDFFSHLIDMSKALGYDHSIMVSSLRNARYYRACHTALGFEFKIHRPAPEYASGKFEGLEHYLSVSHLTGAQIARRAA